ADSVPMAVTVLTMYWAYFIHANVNWRFGWLEWLISTPGFHHWHHTNDGPQVVDKNYSAMLPWVDKCFGYAHRPRPDRPASRSPDIRRPHPRPPRLFRRLLPATTGPSSRCCPATASTSSTRGPQAAKFK